MLPSRAILALQENRIPKVQQLLLNAASSVPLVNTLSREDPRAAAALQALRPTPAPRPPFWMQSPSVPHFATRVHRERGPAAVRRRADPALLVHGVLKLAQLHQLFVLNAMLEATVTGLAALLLAVAYRARLDTTSRKKVSRRA